MPKILVTGAFGLVGSDLVPALWEKYGQENVWCLSYSTLPAGFGGQVVEGSVTDKPRMEEIIRENQIDTVYHLAGILSAGSEAKPQLAWEVNYLALKHLLDLAIDYKFKMFWPSSIAAFGPTTPRDNTPQHTVLEPNTMYGVNKVSGELLCQYYQRKFGVDVRSLRYPGLLGYKADPGDGTTEYAISIFYDALKSNKFSCFLKADTRLPMMYMDDAIRGTIDLMEAPADKLSIHMAYNFAAISFTPAELVAEIQKLMPDFTCTYKPDGHQAIADSWPMRIDDTQARKDWGWQHEFDLTKMTEVMLAGIEEKLGIKR